MFGPNSFFGFGMFPMLMNSSMLYPSSLGGLGFGMPGIGMGLMPNNLAMGFGGMGLGMLPNSIGGIGLGMPGFWPNTSTIPNIAPISFDLLSNQLS